MIHVSSGDPVALTTFLVEGVDYTPDEGTVSVTVLSPTGTQVHSASVSFDADYGIPQGLLEVSSGQVLSFFRLRVTFTSEGRVRMFSDVIQTHYPFMYFYGPKDVRQVLGVYEEEMPDAEFNLPVSFSELTDELGLSTLTGNDVAKVNELVMLHEAVKRLPALELKILKSNEVDDVKKSRLSSVKVDQVKTDVQARYWKVKSSLSGVTPLPQDPLVAFGARPDAFTGS